MLVAADAGAALAITIRLIHVAHTPVRALCLIARRLLLRRDSRERWGNVSASDELGGDQTAICRRFAQIFGCNSDTRQLVFMDWWDARITAVRTNVVIELTELLLAG